MPWLLPAWVPLGWLGRKRGAAAGVVQWLLLTWLIPGCIWLLVPFPGRANGLAGPGHRSYWQGHNVGIVHLVIRPTPINPTIVMTRRGSVRPRDRPAERGCRLAVCRTGHSSLPGRSLARTRVRPPRTRRRHPAQRGVRLSR